MAYLLQFLTNGHVTGLEVEAGTLGDLNIKTREMVTNHPYLMGREYRILKIDIKESGKLDFEKSVILKRDRIKKIDK